ncbi:hypothetical protein KR009_003840 [Drosophila setifemur]|nr:hypothetical protein KR009_003840 [Drosophila setifemur]
MANPKSSGGKHNKKGHHRHSNQQNQNQNQNAAGSGQEAPVTPTYVEATRLEDSAPTMQPLVSHPSEDTLALAAAVAASIPAAPLATAMPLSQNQNQEPGNEGLATTPAGSSASGPAENRRSLFQRLFGWTS